MGYDEIIFLLIAALALGAAAVLGRAAAVRVPAWLLLAGVGLRVLGSTVRYEILFRFYNGFGDAVEYYQEGLSLSGYILSWQISPLSWDFWFYGIKWWGTQFLTRLSALVLTVIGPSMRGEFLAFALLAFLGLLALAVGFRRIQPDQAHDYAVWLFLWPSLWFWPSSVGKEAVLMLTVGLTTLGYVGKTGERIRWPLYLAGLGLTFCIRPHVAALLAFATGIAHWLGAWRRLTLRRLAEAAGLVILAALAFNGMKVQFGLEDADLEGLREFVEYRSEQTLSGGSNIGAPPLSLIGIPLACINVWLRPFPWDVSNATTAFAALEILVFLGLVWSRRRGLRHTLGAWRRNRLLRFVVPLVVAYTLMIGFTFGNLGIIARQRTPMFPFVFMILMSVPQRPTERRDSTSGSTALPASPDSRQHGRSTDHGAGGENR